MASTRAQVCPHCGGVHPVGTSLCPKTQRPMPPPDSGLVIPRGAPTRSGAARSTARAELIGVTIDAKYKVRSVLGEGGMGTVFEAEQLSIGRSVAIKVLHPSQARKPVTVKRFHQEARAVGSIGHPNICEVYDMGALSDGSPYLVLERLTGQTLAGKLGAEGDVSPSECIEIFTQVASALVAAHECGILHRDIKPENVFLSQRPGCPPIVKLLDFGVSKVVGTTSRDAFDDETLTKTGMVMGTPYYMAPEQARGERDLDGRVDVYACGVVMYEILAGKRPFSGANYNALLLQILTATPAPLRSLAPEVPQPLERLVQKAMSRARADRFASASELRTALVELASRRGADRRAVASSVPMQRPEEDPALQRATAVLRPQPSATPPAASSKPATPPAPVAPKAPPPVPVAQKAPAAKADAALATRPAIAMPPRPSPVSTPPRPMRGGAVPSFPVAPSARVPISFIDSSEVEADGDGDEATLKRALKPEKPAKPPLPDYAEANAEPTAMMTREEIEERVEAPAQSETPSRSPKSDPSLSFDEQTVRMDSDQVREIALAAMKLGRRPPK